VWGLVTVCLDIILKKPDYEYRNLLNNPGEIFTLGGDYNTPNI
jgi:hypothetical protein